MKTIAIIIKWENNTPTTIEAHKTIQQANKAIEKLYDTDNALPLASYSVKLIELK